MEDSNNNNGNGHGPLDPITLERAREIVLNLAARVKESASHGLTPDVFNAALKLRVDSTWEYYEVEKAIKKSGSIPIAEWRLRLSDFEMSQYVSALNLETLGKHAEQVFTKVDLEKEPAFDFNSGDWFNGSPDQDPVAISAQVWAALEDAESASPTLFWSNGVLSRLEVKEGAVKLSPVTNQLLSYRLAHLKKWVRFNKKTGEPYLVPPPLTVVAHMLAAPQVDTPIPMLKRVVTAPVFSADGRLILTPGFDRQSGIYFVPSFTPLRPHDQITDEHVAKAKEFIFDEFLHDFPFASDSDKQNAVSLMILPFIRDMIEGFTPIHLVEASLCRSGKGLLVESLLGLVGNYSLVTYSPDEAEIAKTITTALMAKKDALLFDNINDVFSSGKLCAAVTCHTTWDDRLLGKNQSCDVFPRLIWAATANNPTLSSEIQGRTLRIRLTPDTDKPELRSAFKHDELDVWVKANRPMLSKAAHVLVLNWLQKGRPVPARKRTMGRFENYIKIMGGIMDAAGMTQFLGNQDQFREAADVERYARAALCHEWYRLLPNADGMTAKSLTAGDLWERVGQTIEGLQISGKDGPAMAKSFGKYLQRCVDIFPEYEGEAFPTEDSELKVPRVREKFALTRGKISRGRQMWELTCLKTEMVD